MVLRLKMLVTQNLCEIQNWAINLVWSFLYKIVSIFFKVTKENHSSTCSPSEDSSTSNFEFFSLQVLVILLLKSELDTYLQSCELSALSLDPKSINAVMKSKGDVQLVMLKHLHYNPDFKVSEKFLQAINDDFNQIELLISRLKKCLQPKRVYTQYERYPDFLQYLLRQRDFMLDRYQLGQFLDLYLKQVQLFWYEIRLLQKKGCPDEFKRKCKLTQTSILSFYNSEYETWHRKFSGSVPLIRTLR